MSGVRFNSSAIDRRFVGRLDAKLALVFSGIRIELWMPFAKMAIKRFHLLALVWFGLWSATSFSAPAGYYLGWAEIDPIERGIQVSFNPIDCNVCSFAVILPQENGVLVAHFDVSLIASDQLPEAQEGKIVSRNAKLIREGKIRECPDPPCLVLGEKGEMLRIEVSSNRSLKLSELMLLTADSVDLLSASGLFEKVDVKTRRTIEADPMRSLEPSRLRHAIVILIMRCRWTL